jgi:hypothetical protein
MEARDVVWQAYTPEELAALVPGAIVVTRYTEYVKPKAVTTPWGPLGGSPVKGKKVTYEERIFVNHAPGRGIVKVEFSFENENGIEDYCDTEVGYFMPPPHEALHGDFSSDF